MRALRKTLKSKCSRLWLPILWRKHPHKRKKLAIFKPDGIGDFVLSSEAIRALIEEQESGQVSLIVSAEVQSLAVRMFPRAEIITIVPGHARPLQKILGLLQLRRAVGKNAYNEVVCLRHYRTGYEEAILRAVHAGKLILLPNQSRAAEGNADAPVRFRFAKVNQLRQEANTPREWSFHASVLSEALKRAISAESLRPNWDKWKRSVNMNDRFLLVAPLAGRQIRDIPPRLVTAAASKASANGMHHFVLTGSKAQSAQLSCYVSAIRHALPHSRIEVAHPQNLPAFVDVAAKAALVVTAESSAAHIATALDKPALIVIGGGHYGWFAPWRRSDKQVWLTNKLPCFDCNWRCRYPEPFCITGLTAAQVEAALPVAE